MLRTRTTFTGILGSLLLLAACGDDPMAPEAGRALDFEIPAPSLAESDGGQVNTDISVSTITVCGGVGTVTVEIEGIAPPADQAPLEVVLVLDESGSISPTEFTFVRQAAVNFVNSLDFSRTQVGIVMFSDVARTVLPLSGSQTTVVNTLNSIVQDQGFTNMGDGLLHADALFSSNPNAIQSVLLMSDGANNRGPDPVTTASGLKSAGVEIFTVGVGGFVDTGELVGIASPNRYFPAADFEDLEAVFAAIAGEITYPAGLDLTFTATVPAGFTYAGNASASTGTVTENAGTVTWTVDRLEEEVITLTYDIQHDAAAEPSGGLLTAVTGASTTFTTPKSTEEVVDDHADVDTEVQGCDTTPPEISYVLDGTLGDNDWYVSDVDLTWTVVDPDSPVTIDDGCVDETFLTDGTYTRSCAASSDGGEAGPVDVTFKRDATAPTVDYAGNLGAYDIADPVEILCTVDDNLSGVAGDTCADLTGGAWTFDLGLNEFSAEATDGAGNVGAGATAFTVDVSYDGLCALVEAFVTHKGVANSLCVKLAAAERAAERGNANAQAGPLGAFIQEVEAQDGKKVPSEIAPVLIAGAQALMP